MSLNSSHLGRGVCQGIQCGRRGEGRGALPVNIMVDGQRIHRVIGRESDGVTWTQAEEFIAKAKTEAREGRLHLPRPSITRPVIGARRTLPGTS